MKVYCSGGGTAAGFVSAVTVTLSFLLKAWYFEEVSGWVQSISSTPICNWWINVLKPEGLMAKLIVRRYWNSERSDKRKTTNSSPGEVKIFSNLSTRAEIFGKEASRGHPGHNWNRCNLEYRVRKDNRLSQPRNVRERNDNWNTY